MNEGHGGEHGMLQGREEVKHYDSCVSMVVELKVQIAFQCSFKGLYSKGLI